MYNVDGQNISPSEIVNIAKFLFLLFQDLNTVPNKETTLMRKDKFQQHPQSMRMSNVL